ncbi:unnamed protein product [Fraxinus pennsylvanica]|uniref:Uncharacterized protein n=1 Tax=Fraxinus pennsylvanica TaxID=56036 RepID=A0AAD1ZLE9_9LAMI|nr:unnamed protein product [Fraxinus pennsylvanica]
MTTTIAINAASTTTSPHTHHNNDMTTTITTTLSPEPPPLYPQHPTTSPTPQDKQLLELICTKHYNRTHLQLRVVVLVLGSFLQLYSNHLWPLLKPSSLSSSSLLADSAWPCPPWAPT